MLSGKNIFTMTNENNFSIWDCFCGIGGIIICSILFVAAFFIAIFVGISYVPMENDQIGFERNKVSNKIDLDHVYTRGLHFLGVGYEFITFPSLWQRVTFSGNNRLSVSTTTGQEFSFSSFDFWYRLPHDSIESGGDNKLRFIFETFGRSAYKEQINSKASSAIKRTTNQFTVDDFYERRREVQAEICKEIAIKIQNDMRITIPLNRCQMGRPDFRSDVVKRNLDNAVQSIENRIELIEQELESIKATTDQIISAINDNTTFTATQAEAISSFIIKSAEAEAFKIREDTNTIGLKIIFEGLDVDDPEFKGLYWKYTQLRKSHGTKLYDGFEKATRNIPVA